jgi:hypothetical protein
MSDNKTEQDDSLSTPPGMELIPKQVVVLDGGYFVHKHFYECNIIYRGGSVPVLRDNVFDKCIFTFEGPAINTVNFLLELMRAGESSRQFVLEGILGLVAHGKS